MSARNESAKEHMDRLTREFTSMSVLERGIWLDEIRRAAIPVVAPTQGADDPFPRRLPNESDASLHEREDRWNERQAAKFNATQGADARPVAIAIPVPTERGIYAWIAEGSASLVLVHTRPSDHSPGGVLKATNIRNCTFYEGCPVEQWHGGTWYGPLTKDATRDTVPIDAQVIGWWDSTEASGFRWKEGIVRSDISDGTPIHAAIAPRNET